MTARRLVATAVLTCALCAPSGAAAGTVAFTGGSHRSVDLTTLTPDVPAVTYTVRTATGPNTHLTITGYSLSAVLQAADIGPSAFDTAAVLRSDGQVAATLLQGDISNPEDYQRPPVVWDDEDGTHFLRPSRGKGDDNGDEEVTGTPLVLRLSGAREALGVVATASVRTTKTGRLVTFRATSTGFGDDTALRYSWVFDDGHRASGQTVSHSFTRTGSYRVLATAVDAHNADRNTSDAVRVQVGTPVKGRHDRAGGGHNDDAAAPTSGASSGGVAGAATGGTGATAAAAAAPTPAAHRAPATHTGRKPPPAPKPTHPAPASVPRLAPPTSTARRATATATRSVHGRLLSVPPGSEVVALATPVAAAPRVATRSGTLRRAERDDGGFTVPTVVWELALVALLLSTGWWLDRRDSNAFPSLPWTP
jgi:hypothetical protein